MSVEALHGKGEWAGEEMSDEEIQDLVGLLEEHIKGIKSGRTRGVAVASVGNAGIGCVYRTNFDLAAGCSKLSLSGAVHVLANKVDSALNEADD